MATINLPDLSQPAKPDHSPLGASGAERWMNCPGSVTLLKKLTLEPSDEPDYRKNGVAAHEAAAKCLIDGLEDWEVMGEKFHGVVVDKEMATAIAVYLNAAGRAPTNGARRVEMKLSSTDHDDMYGTADLVDICETESTMVVTDFKYGEGIQVEVENNPQVMYYAYMALLHYPHIRNVRLRIVQPRGFHHQGPVRSWPEAETEWLKSEMIFDWAEKELIPAMHATEVDNKLDSGPWCRFCPAKLVCPMLTGLFKAAALTDPGQIINISNETLGRDYQYREAVKFYLKAQDDEMFRRLNSGQEIPGAKMVYKKANRVWKPEALEKAQAKWGDEAMTKPEIKSPAAIAAIDSEAKDFVKEWAYTPQTGLTVAPASDKRVGVKIQTSTEAFGAAASQLTGE